MSFEAMAWAVRQECGSAPSKLVLLMLANHSNGHTGQCNPRIKTLAAECEIRPETLKTHLKNLEERGYLTVIPQYSDGVQLPNQYRLNFGGGGGENRMGGRGDFAMGGGGEKHWGGGGENRPPNKQESKPVNETGIETREAPRKRSASIPCPSDVDPQTWADWLALRKAKRAPVTETVVAGARREADKAGMPLEAFLQVWCRRGSQGLEAAWLKPDERGQQANNNKHAAAAAAIFDGVFDD
jgi:hypothetical protein